MKQLPAILVLISPEFCLRSAPFVKGQSFPENKEISCVLKETSLLVLKYETQGFLNIPIDKMKPIDLFDN